LRETRLGGGSPSSSAARLRAAGPGIGLGLHPAGLAAQPQVAFEGRETQTPKEVSATSSPRGIPRSAAANTLSLRSFEYALMHAASHGLNAQASRCEPQTGPTFSSANAPPQRG
jgi:hypothetical protein